MDKHAAAAALVLWALLLKRKRRAVKSRGEKAQMSIKRSRLWSRVDICCIDICDLLQSVIRKNFAGSHPN